MKTTKRRFKVSFDVILVDTEETGLDDDSVINELVHRLIVLTDSIKQGLQRGQRIPSPTDLKSGSPGYYKVGVDTENESVLLVEWIK